MQPAPKAAQAAAKRAARHPRQRGISLRRRGDTRRRAVRLEPQIQGARLATANGTTRFLLFLKRALVRQVNARLETGDVAVGRGLRALPEVSMGTRASRNAG